MDLHVALYWKCLVEKGDIFYIRGEGGYSFLKRNSKTLFPANHVTDDLTCSFKKVFIQNYENVYDFMKHLKKGTGLNYKKKYILLLWR